MLIELHMQKHGLLYWNHYTEFSGRQCVQLLITPTAPEKVAQSCVSVGCTVLGGVSQRPIEGVFVNIWRCQLGSSLNSRDLWLPHYVSDVGAGKAWLLAAVVAELRQRKYKFMYAGQFPKTTSQLEAVGSCG